MEHTPYRSPLLLSRLAMVGIGLDGFLGLTDVILGFGFLTFPPSKMDLGDGVELSIWVLAMGLVALAKFPVYVFAVVTFLMWLYRSYTNLPALRSDNTEFSPGWAVGWWFIPFANLVKPFQAVRTLWSESDPEFDGESGFLSKIQTGAPTFMVVWWAAWLLSNFSSNAAGRLFDPDSKTGVEIGAYAYIFAGLTSAIAAMLAIKVVSSITDRQEERFASVGRIPSLTPPPPPTFNDDRFRPLD